MKRTRALAIRRGFSLLEVMVALAVLALNMGVIMVGQSQIFSKANYAKDVIGAVAVARAKIFDLEQKFRVDGFGDFDKEADEECDRESPMYRCEWTLKRIELPISQMLDAAAAKAGDVQAAMAAAMGGGDRGASGPQPADARANVVAMMGNFKGPIQMLQDQLEEMIRELKLTVKWKEGKDATEWEHFTVVTHLVDFKTPGLPGSIDMGALGAAAGLPGASGTPGAPAARPSIGRIGSIGMPR